jgi:hypothetical protein
MFKNVRAKNANEFDDFRPIFAVLLNYFSQLI